MNNAGEASGTPAERKAAGLLQSRGESPGQPAGIPENRIYGKESAPVRFGYGRCFVKQKTEEQTIRSSGGEGRAFSLYRTARFRLHRACDRC